MKLQQEGLLLVLHIGFLEKLREMEDSSSILEVMLKRIKDLADGSIGEEIGALTTKGVKVVKAHKGFLLCELIVHNGLLDENGNWHVGAIATLVDTIANVASITNNSHHHVTLDFTISYYSTAKVQEEVEAESKVVGKKDKLKSLIVEVRKKGNKELIAMGKLWMAAAKRNSKQQTSKL